MIAETAVERVKPTTRLADKIKLRQDYVKGHGSLETLCAKHNVPLPTARQWFQAEKWTKLKLRYDQRMLVRIGSVGTSEEQQSVEISGSLTERQLARVNEALLACDDADEILKLAKAKQTLEECLSVERNGAKPGTMKPTGKTRRQAVNLSPRFDPEPAADPAADTQAPASQPTEALSHPLSQPPGQ